MGALECGAGAPHSKGVVEERTGILKILRDLIAKNWWLKLSALLLSFALWLVVRGDDGERVFIVPLTVQVPRNMEIANERPSSVEVTAAGGSTLSGRLPEMTYTIDLHDAAEGSHIVPLTPDGVWFNPTADVRIVRVNPARVSIVLERIISREVPVRVPLQGNPPAGMEVYQVTVVPETVSISGRRSQVDLVREATAAPVAVSGKKESFQTKVNFRLQSDDIHAIPAEARVTVELGVRRMEQTVTVPVAVSDPESYSVSPLAIAVSVLVPATLNRKLAPEDFKAVVAVPAEGWPGSQIVAKPAVELAATLDPGIRITLVKPETVTLQRISRKK
jgi:YbbR domain-containing protein